MIFRKFAELLQQKSEAEFIQFLANKQDGYEVQESCFRLFAYLLLIPIINEYTLCKGNFNTKTICKVDNISALLDKELSDKGDMSDFTAMRDNELLITTSKNLKNYHVGDLDLLGLNAIALNRYKQYKIRYVVVIPNKDILKKTMSNAEQTSISNLEILNDPTTIIIDHADLIKCFIKFKQVHRDTDFSKYSIVKSPIYYKFHQILAIKKTIELIANHKNVLWGHLPRSGKSYIMAGTINELYENDDHIREFLIITTAPSETISAYINLFQSSIEFDDFDILLMPRDKDKINKKNSKIIICSKQYLHTKLGKKKIAALAKIKYDCIFIDEVHNGGTTERSDEILETYKGDKYIFITATYQKPIDTYDINENAYLLWDIEDIALARQITIKSNQKRLIEKHGPICADLLKNYNLKDIEKEYSIYPSLHIITPKLLDDIRDEIKSLVDSNYGFSVESLFMLQHDKKIVKSEFVDKNQVIRFMKYILGNSIKKKHIEIPDENCLLTRAAHIAQQNNMDYWANTPIILVFLPCNLNKMPINKLSIALRNIITENFSEFGCIDINSIANKGQNVKTIIYDNHAKAELDGKKALIVLSCKQASLGISLKECHTVILLNNTTSMDLLHQMMFRSMTEATGKTCGFVIDLNIHRALNMVYDYTCKIGGNSMGIHTQITSILKQRLLLLNYDEFEVKELQYNKIIDKIVSILTQPNTISSVLHRIRIKNELFNKNEMNMIYEILAPNKKTIREINKEIKKLVDDIPNGIEKIEVERQTVETPIAEIDDKDININQQFLIYIIPLLCLLSIHQDSSSLDAIINFIDNDKELNNCLINQLQVFYPNIVPANVMKIFKLIYERDIKNNKQNADIIVRLKELFSLHLHERQRLGELIDKYLIPHENERRQNAEVSTPYKLRQEMLDSMTQYGDVDFWKTPKTVFEPCCGKGGFVVDVIERFNVGLVDVVPDQAERYRYILEHCIYFADINPLNIFITRLLIDPFGQYKINYYEGDTLKIDIQKEFKLDGFDLVVGNPPYQKGNGNKGLGNTLWDMFVYMAITKWLKQAKYLIYVHPCGWRQINNKCGKLILSKQILYLNMNDLKMGLSVFHCATTYDYYLLENIYCYKNTIINDYKNIECKLLLKDKEFIPNYLIIDVYKLISMTNNCGFIKDRSSYGTEYKHISKVKTNIFKYPCVYSINKQNELNLRYSSKNNLGHFGICKFIVSNGEGYYKDINGNYALTEWAYALPCKIDDIDFIEKCFKSKKFKEIVNAVKLTSNKYNYSVIKYFKKDFWREFINDENTQ